MVSEYAAAVAKDEIYQVGKTVTTEIKALIGHRKPFIDVVLRDSLVFCDSVIELNRDFERLQGVGIEISALIGGGVRNGRRVGVHDVLNLRLESVPGLFGERPGNIVVPVVKDFVPKGMQLINIIVVLEREHIGTLVAVFSVKLFQVVAVLAVEGLHEVAHVVNEETESVGLSNVFVVVELLHEMLVHVARFVVIAHLAREPRDNIVECGSQIARALVGIEVALLAILNPWHVDEVEVSLPAFTVVFVVVSKRRTLNKSVLILVRR